MQNERLAGKLSLMNCVKANFDGSYCAALHVGSVGVVVHD